MKKIKFCFSALPAFVLPAALRDVSFPTQSQFAASVPPEAARLIVAMATATARLRGAAQAVVAELLEPLVAQAPMRALLWSLCVANLQDALPADVAQTVAEAILAQLARAATADLQLDELVLWRADLLASALAHPRLAPLAESAATAWLDDACAGRRPLLDVVLVGRRVAPLVRGAVPRLRALLADRAALLHLVALERVSTTPTAAEAIVDVFASSGDALVPLADDLVHAAASSLADETLRPIALAVVRGVCLRLSGIDYVSPTRTALLAALKPSLLPLLVQHIGSDGDALLDSLVAVVAGSRDAEAAVALTCAAAQRDSSLFAVLLNRWYRAFPDLVRAVLGAALDDDDNESAALLELLARVAASNPSAVGVAVRECVRAERALLIAQLALADERESHALASFALLHAAFSIVDGETCDAFGDGAAHGQVRRVRALRDAVCQLRFAAHASHAVELVKLFVADVVLRDVEPNSVAMIAAADSLVAIAAPLADERVTTPTSGGSSRLASALPQGSLLLAACERHKRARMHSGAASANSASTLFSGKEFVKPAARAPRPLALATPPAYEAGDELSQHALDLLSRVCAADERRLGAVRSALVFRANVAAGIVPTGNNGSGGSGGVGGGGGGGGIPPTPAHEGATSAPPTPSQKRDEQPPQESVPMSVDANSTTVVLSCAWTTAGVPGGDAVGHTTARRLCDWLNGAPRLLDVVRLVARDGAAFQRERVLVMLVQSGLAIHGRRLAAGARSEFELRRLAGVCRQLGWTSASLAALAEQCSHEDVRDVMAALRETLGDGAAANAQANALSVGALEHGSWEAVFRSRSIEWR